MIVLTCFMPFLEGGKGLDSKNLRPIEYYGQTVMVTQEVAEFLDKDEEIFKIAIKAVNNFKDFAQRYLRQDSTTN